MLPQFLELGTERYRFRKLTTSLRQLLCPIFDIRAAQETRGVQK